MTFAERHERINWIAMYSEYKREDLKGMNDEEISRLFKEKVVTRK